MALSFSKPTFTALPSALLIMLLVTPAAAQSAPPIVDPGLAQCAEWKLRYQTLIDQHVEAGGLSSAARDRATDLAYGAYSRCVMGGKPGETDGAVASLKAIQDVLESGRSLARSDPLPRASSK